jgi:hypothetical protein
MGFSSLKFCFLQSLSLHDHVAEFTEVTVVKPFWFNVALFSCAVSVFDLIIVTVYTGVDGYMHASPGRIGGDSKNPEV